MAGSGELKYIGDLSKQDARLIREYTLGAGRILEFGVGASTQVIAQTIGPDTRFDSIDTDSSWIDKTKFILEKFGVLARVNFGQYKSFVPAEKYDLLLDDGMSKLRKEFAFKYWEWLKPGGFFLLHDTRDSKHQKTITEIVKKKFTEIEEIRCNEKDSNLTVIKKCAPVKYVNWNVAEGKEKWQFGHTGNEMIPEDFWN